MAIPRAFLLKVGSGKVNSAWPFPRERSYIDDLAAPKYREKGSKISQSTLFIAGTVLFPLATSVACATLPAQVRQPLSAVQIVDRMVQSEKTAWKDRQHFLYRKEEKSNRTKGHLWEELVVETEDGPMERLIAEDGKPLSPTQERDEQKRIANLAKHPGQFRRENQRRKDDESRMPQLLEELPRIYLFQNLGTDGEYTRIAFQPNPSFQEKTYQDRVVHAMSGVMLIHTADMRLRRLDVQLEHKVEFGFGLLGVVSDTTHFSLARKEVLPGYWEPTKIRVHLDGTILLMKSISRDVESSQHGFELVPHDMTVAEAAGMVRSKP